MAQSDARPLWSPSELANYLGVPVTTIYRWQHIGTAPPSIRLGRHTRYRPDAVDRWLNAKENA
ncbi:AlpA family transcriptional regulator [Haloactinospora alba]|uniref:AlpA family transcriptional regulator n=1 Tax=Haloactinospora alba TaxID=405555 RepID=A0A543NJM0_9ACTN|nr:helix-turn-helix domain-containing protein [Haloactinospora alba]TQN32061.1 AlpA family transcriptional regulator [Haloactinospora alba]